jgi:hypothetical protein
MSSERSFPSSPWILTLMKRAKGRGVVVRKREAHLPLLLP